MRELRWPALLALAGCFGCQANEPVPVVSPLSEVAVDLPETRDVTDYEEFTGHTDAILSVQIKARVTGYLMKKDFQDGQDVKEGDILYEIDDRPYKMTLDSAESMVAQGEAHRTRLAADYRRASNLFQRAAIGKQEFDLISSNFAEAEAQLDASKAQLENARLNMSFTKVRAPMTGQLSRTLVDPGNLIRQDSTILNDIVSTERLYAYFDVSSDAMKRVSAVIEEGHVGGKDNKDVPVEVGTSVDSDRYEDCRKRQRDIGDEILLVEAQRKKIEKDADDQMKKLDLDAEDQVNRLSEGYRGAKESLEEEVDARKKKLATDLEARQRKLVTDLAANDQALQAKKKRLDEETKATPLEFPYKGMVNFSENKLDAATGTLRVRGVIENPAPASILSPGLFVRIRLPIGQPEPALLVPEDAIGSDQGRGFVYIVTPTDDVEYRPIVLGALFEGEAGRKKRAVLQGIVAGERFIQDSEAIRRVRPGARVKPIQRAVQLAATPTPAAL
jgi:multidrug efflux pump subunit AcrA (membrane-fusion protein)